MVNEPTERLARYRDVLRLLFRHGASGLLSDLALNDVGVDRRELGADDVAGDPKSLVQDLEALGPTFIKLGQALSMRPDILPGPYRDELAKLQDKIEPFPFADVQRIVEGGLNVRMSRAFADFSAEPLAAASLGQVHAARLRDGRRVAVKVQRPGIRETIAADLDDLRVIAGLLERYTDVGDRFGVSGILEEFERALLEELDYEQEAHNLKTMARLLERYDDIVIPLPVDDYCGTRVLTMTHIDGQSVADLSGFGRLETDVQDLAATLCKSYLDQILLHGFVHADPHSGNVFLTADGRLALLDLGMVAHVDPDMRARLLRLLLALTESRGETVAEVCLAISTPLDGADRDRAMKQTAALVSRYGHLPGGTRKMGQAVLDLVQVAVDNRIRPAAEITLLGKTLLYLDEIAHELTPDFDPEATVRRHCGKILNRHLSGSLDPTRVMSSLLDAHLLADELPKQAHKLLTTLADNRFKIEVKSISENVLMRNIEKVANRITAGLVLAALIIGAALLMPIETAWTIFGYPGLAIILFAIAAVGGLILVVDILIVNRHDRSSE